MNVDEFKSEGELHFYMWLKEAFHYGIITYAEYEPVVFPVLENQKVMLSRQMKTKVKEEEKTLFTNAGTIEYTPDFALTLTDLGATLLGDTMPRGIQLGSLNHLWIDTKGSGGKSGSNQVFFLKQRLMWREHGIFVEKVVP